MRSVNNIENLVPTLDFSQLKSYRSESVDGEACHVKDCWQVAEHECDLGISKNCVGHMCHLHQIMYPRLA